MVVSPDVGGVARARAFAKKLNGAPLAIVDKRRSAHNVSEVMNLIGDVRGKVAVLVDDMIDTAGTITNGARPGGARTGSVAECVCIALPMCEGVVVFKGRMTSLQEAACTESGAGAVNLAACAAHGPLPPLSRMACPLLKTCRSTTGTHMHAHQPPPPPPAQPAAAKHLREQGARSVYACATHAVFSPPAIERLSSGVFEEVIVTNTISMPPDNVFPQLTVLSVANLLGEHGQRSSRG